MQISAKAPFLPAWLCFLIVGVIAGTLDVWMLIGWKEIDPRNLSWLAGDPAQYEVGWEFLRHEKVWRFPLTWITRLDYPSGVSASNLDFIPLVGTVLRPFGPVMPADFQYLGLFAVACYCLQTFYGLRLVSLFAKGDLVITVAGGAFFLLSPILTMRLYGHFPHSAHWIIVACIYYYFRFPTTNNPAQYLTPFVVLCAIAAAITPYIAFMAMALGAAAMWRSYLAHGELGTATSPEKSAPNASRPPLHAFEPGTWGGRRANYLLWGGLLLLSTLLSLTVFGFMVPGHSQFAGSGYTTYSMNILGPINPQDGALFFKHIPVLSGQEYEGYNYLGMGVLFLLLVSLIRKPALVVELWSISTRPLVIASALLTLLALSLKVAIADHVLFTILVPKFIYNMLAAFRSSARFFWPVNYLVVLGGIVGALTVIPARWSRRAILIFALLLQYFDVLSVRNGVAAAAHSRHLDPLSARDWFELPKTHRHLLIQPAMQCDPDLTPGGMAAWAQLARLVARNGMTLNSAYLGRVSPETHALDCTTIPDRILHDGLRPDSAYVLSDGLALAVSGQPGLTHYCRRVDDLNLCTYDPVRAHRSRSLADGILSKYELGRQFDSENPQRHLLLLEGFDLRPGWGMWTVGKQATIYVRLPDIGTALRMEMEFTNVLLSPRHTRQRAFVSVNGRAAGNLQFRTICANRFRSLVIPSRPTQPGGVTVIRFDLPDAVAPNEIGMGDDGRQLALYLHRFAIVSAEESADDSGGCN